MEDDPLAEMVGLQQIAHLFECGYLATERVHGLVLPVFPLCNDKLPAMGGQVYQQRPDRPPNVALNGVKGLGCGGPRRGQVVGPRPRSLPAVGTTRRHEGLA